MSGYANKTRAEVMRLVSLLAREGRRIAEAFADEKQLHVTDVEALAYIMRAEAQGVLLTAGGLGGELGLTSGATTFLMTRLTRAGLVGRTRDPDDRRRVHLALSPAGRKLAATIYPPVTDASEAVLDAFTPAELETVRRFLAATAQAMVSYRVLLSPDTSSQPPQSRD